MSRSATISDPMYPAGESPSGPPALPETGRSPAHNGPVQKSGFEFLASLKRSLTGEAVSSKQLLIVTSQLAVMLAAGCDLCAGLDALARQQSHAHLKRIMADLHDRVKQGQSFSAALARHPQVFSDLYVTMVRA